MDLLRELVKQLDETAAGGSTSAGAVAGFRAPIGFSGTSSHTKMQRRNIPTLFKRTPRFGYYDVNYDESDFGDGFEGGGEEEEVMHKRAKRLRKRSKKPVLESYTSNFDSADVIAKLRSAQQKANHEQDVVGFALEDSEGNIVKVFVAADEAEPFERALAAELGKEDTDEDSDNTPLEIAEVLFNLKDRFTIADVEWPAIEGDPEEEEDTADEDSLEADVNIDVDAEGDEVTDEEDMTADDEMVADEEPSDSEDVKSALSSVIDLLKTQADAQKAQASASKAEAEAEEAKWNAQAAEMKLKQEEQVLDMEAYYDKKKEEKQEAERLKKLAKWKHAVAQQAEDEMDDMPAMESFNPFMGPIDYNHDRKMSPKEYIRYLFKHAKGQH